MRDVTRWTVRCGFVLVGLILVASAVLAGRFDVGHAQFHVLIALVMLVGAAVILRTRPQMGVGARWLMLGLLAFAAAQFVEAIGAFGFGTDGYSRINDVVLLHDLGLGLTPIGLILLGFGAALAGSRWFADLASRWIPRSVAFAVSLTLSLVVVAIPFLTLMGIQPF